jgi:hypothetical protein
MPDQAEFSCVIISGSADESGDEIVRVTVRKDGRNIVKFELSAGDFFKAISGRLTLVELQR